eukprot:GILK01002615.1.p1 GENE.GILK01002615.1~~GILK01002615.1.p1  ORF type:complete len:282 (+),score=71.85 GILK01002615.1:42-848(+)
MASFTQTVPVVEGEENESNEKLDLLRNQLDGMTDVFTDLSRAREAQSKREEARLEELNRKISGVKEMLLQESKRVDDSLRAFQAKFEFRVSQIETKFQSELQAAVTGVNDELSSIAARIQQVAASVDLEREERKQQSDEMLEPIRAHLSSLQSDLEGERQVRLEGEKQVLKHLADEVFNANQKMEAEKHDREVKMMELKAQIVQDNRVRDKHEEQFRREMFERLEALSQSIVNESVERKQGQDQLVDNMSGFINTFQTSLKVVTGTRG